MARPKSYADEDIIKIATQLISKGKKPSGWSIKEVLGRGKISAIQSDLDRLIKGGHISAEVSSLSSKESEEAIVFLSYDLPAELQDLLAKREEELCKTFREITTMLNNKAHEHYETIMAIRVRDLDAKYNLTYQAKKQAEAELSDIEQRLQKQVEEKEHLEDKIEELECDLAESKQNNSELLQHNLHLTNNLSAAAEKYDTLQGSHQDLIGQLSALQNDHTAVTVKLEFALSENKKLHTSIAELTGEYDKTRGYLAEAHAKLNVSQSELHKLEVTAQEQSGS
ncbi:plasmid replication DNA-binding protein KfrA [Vibrio crassostreae]|uniref:hypothetical protein n=1 Tax=Vibrio crassostreae TaxID=246167 RepID=UPI000F4A1821|nr:hypothetical protein [Vibrio crassostreae]ROR69516.1 plasmid replication DNA-binding protein KfrA [Vibrio crassostreae]